VHASDDVEVKGVTVCIRTQGGAVLEEGAAVFTTAAASWTYTATTDLAQGQAVSIEVNATDRPGHKTRAHFERDLSKQSRGNRCEIGEFALSVRRSSAGSLRTS
jgi:hypothetical protein